MAEIHLNIIAQGPDDLHHALAGLAGMGDQSVTLQTGYHLDTRNEPAPATPNAIGLPGAPEGDGKVRGANADALVKLLVEMKAESDTHAWKEQFERLPKKDQQTVSEAIEEVTDYGPPTASIIVFAREGEAAAKVETDDQAASVLEDLLEKCETADEMTALAKANMQLVNEVMDAETAQRVKDAFSAAYEAAAKPEAKEEPKAETKPAAKVETVSVDDVRTKVSSVCKSHGMELGKRIITEVGGAAKLSEVGEDRYAAMIAACDAPDSPDTWDVAL